MLLKYKRIKPKINKDAFIAPGTYIIGDVKIGSRSNIWFSVVIRGDVENIKLSKKRKFITFPNGYTYSSELIRDLKKIRDFEIIIAVFPEKHPESKNFGEDIDNLKRKIDLGATKGITQFFFDNNKFYDFMNILQKKNIKKKILLKILLLLVKLKLPII